MVTEGVDYSWGRPDPVQLYAAGKRFACRYVSWGSSGRGRSVLDGHENGKVITRAEAEKLSAAGIAVVTNWEWDAQDQLRGYAGGVADAREADRLHLAAGGPPGRPIYFSTDFDASTAQLATCYEYLRGAASVIGWPRVGVYGGRRTIDYMKARGVRWLWQTYAWSGGVWVPGAQIQQYHNGVQLAGADVDLNRALASDWGQWTIGGTPPEQEEDDMAWDEGLKNEAWPTRADASGQVQSARDRLVITQGRAGEILREARQIRADLARAATERAGLVAAIEALAAGGTSVDTAAVVAAVDRVAAELGAQLAAARADADELRARLAEAIAPTEG